MSIGHLYVLFGEVSIQALCPFFNWVACFFGVEFCKYLINFGHQPLIRCIGEYVLHSVGCLLYFVRCLLCCTKLTHF